MGCREGPGGGHAAPPPTTLFFGAVGDQDGRLGALEGSRSGWGLPLPLGPLPMEAIEKMASLCMRDPDKDEEEGTDEEDVEADDDLLVSTRNGAGDLPSVAAPSGRPSRLAPGCVSLQAELNEVLGEEQKALESHPPVAQVYLRRHWSLKPRVQGLPLPLSAMGPRSGGGTPLSPSSLPWEMG